MYYSLSHWDTVIHKNTGYLNVLFVLPQHSRFESDKFTIIEKYQYFQKVIYDFYVQS